MSGQTLAPVVLFAYARPDHLRRTLDALRANAEAGATPLVVFCDGARRPEQAAEVASATGCASAGLDALPGLAWDVLVNATPLGSGAFPGQSPVLPSALRQGAVVFDMVYEPRETPLLAAARARGCVRIDGVEMLVAQAVGQFEAWTGVPAPVEAMAEAASEAIAESRVVPPTVRNWKR